MVGCLWSFVTHEIPGEGNRIEPEVGSLPRTCLLSWFVLWVVSEPIYLQYNSARKGWMGAQFPFPFFSFSAVSLYLSFVCSDFLCCLFLDDNSLVYLKGNAIWALEALKSQWKMWTTELVYCKNKNKSGVESSSFCS